MRESSISTFIKQGKDVLVPSAEDMNDRIVNLKFIRKNGPPFVIRSDYEVVYLKDGSYYFVKCTQKPSIRVSFQQVASDTAIQVKIALSGLSISREAVGSRMDASDENPILWCVIQLGYRAQFPDWTDDAHKGMLDQFYDLNNNNITSDAEVARGRQILVQILDNYRTSAPPDNGWVFDGTVGTLDTGLVWNFSEESVDDPYTYGVEGFPEGKSQFEAVVYQWITRRFVRPSVEHIRSFDTDEEGNIISEKVEIVGYNNYFTPGANDTARTALEYDKDGLMKIPDANMFGVPVVCSPTLSRLAEKKLFEFAGTADGQTFEAPETLYFDAQSNLGAQLISLQTYYPFLRWYKLANGGFYFYHVNETASDLFNSPAVKENQRDGIYTIPAVYSVSIGGMRTIRMPFTGFIDPLTTVRFNARYAVGSLTGFFYPVDKGDEFFIVILSSVSFSTVGSGEEANAMELSCIDAPADTVDGVVPMVSVEDEDIFTFTSYIADKKKKAETEVKEVSYVIGAKPYEGKNLGWIDIANLFVLPKKTKQWGDAPPTLQNALDSLKKWNASLWASRLTNADGDCPDNERGTFTSKIPWLNIGDTVTYHIPYRPLDA